MITETYYPDRSLKTRLVKTGLDDIYYEFYPDGTLKSRGTLVNGNKLGLFQEYYPNHNLKSEGNYASNGKSGLWSFYREDGTLESIGNFHNDLKNWGWDHYNHKGNKLFTITYLNGVKNGLYVEYYPNKQVRGLGEYKNDEKNGKWIIYRLKNENSFTDFNPVNIYPDIYKITEYVNGQFVKRDFFPKLSKTSRLKKEILDEKGNIVRIEWWDNNEYISTIEENEYYPNGIIKTKIRYYDNKRKDLREYNIKGEKTKIIVYETIEGLENIPKTEVTFEKDVITKRYINDKEVIQPKTSNKPATRHRVSINLDDN